MSGLPIGEDVARAYIDGRNEGRQSERARLREKVEALHGEWQLELNANRTPFYAGKLSALEAVLALLAEPGKEERA